MHFIDQNPQCHGEVMECWRANVSASVLYPDERAGRAKTLLSAYEGESSLITWTSGTTGDPKGVVIPWRAVEARCASLAAVLSKDDMAVVTSMLPANHSGGMITSRLAVMQMGGEFVSWPGREGLTCIVATPRCLALIIAGQENAHTREFTASIRPSLRLIISNGNILKPELRRDVSAYFGVPVLDLYGASELGGACFDGVLLPGYQAAIRDDFIEIRTDGMATGYLGADEAFPLRDGWFRTPDLGEFDGSVLRIVKRPSARKMLK